jgi:hypothetical protein
MAEHADQTRMIHRLPVLLLCALVCALFAYDPGFNDCDHSKFGEMVYGTAHQPYVTRTLLPTTVRLLTAAIPASVRSAVARHFVASYGEQELFRTLGWEPQYVVEFLIGVVLIYLALWGFTYALRYLLHGVLIVHRHTEEALVLIAVAGLTQFFCYQNYVYDFPALFLSTLALGLLVRRRWALFLLVFAAACANKETTILLTLVFVLHFRRPADLPRRAFSLLLLAQLGLYVAIRGVIWAAFRHNIGGLVESHILDHNLPRLGPHPLAVLFAWGAFILLLAQGWADKPRFLKDALWMVLPLLLLAFFFGYIDEMRVYYEVYAVVLLLLLHSIGRVIKFPVECRDTGTRPSLSPG